MFFTHDKCKSVVYLDLTDNIKFLVNYGIDRNSLIIGSGDIVVINDNFDSKFFCPTCNKHIEFSELIHNCFQCGKVFNLKNLFKGSKSGGVYCSDCSKIYLSDESIKNLSLIISHVTFRS